MKILPIQSEEPIAQQKEFFGRDAGIKFAGVHLLVELWNSKYLTNAPKIRRILTQAIEACGASMLSIDLHVFSPNGGVSGVAILKESHISIHTWPEFEYAALDVFVCGTINPHLAVDRIKSEFQPKKIEITEIKRGILP